MGGGHPSKFFFTSCPLLSLTPRNNGLISSVLCGNFTVSLPPKGGTGREEGGEGKKMMAESSSSSERKCKEAISRKKMLHVEEEEKWHFR